VTITGPTPSPDRDTPKPTTSSVPEPIFLQSHRALSGVARDHRHRFCRRTCVVRVRSMQGEQPVGRVQALLRPARPDGAPGRAGVTLVNP
jgi:hypothetical protein